MDTHPADFAATLSSHCAEACLPGEGATPPAGTPEPVVATAAPAPLAAPRKPRRRRRALLSSACVVVVAAVAGGVFLISPYNHVYPVDAGRLDASVRKLAAEAGAMLPPLMAPAARLASAPAPQRHEAPVWTAEQMRSRAESLRQVLGFRAGVAAETSPGQGDAPVAVAGGAGPHARAGATPAAAAAATTLAVPTAAAVEPNVALPVPVRPGAAAVPLASPVPHDPVALPAPSAAAVLPAPAVLSAPALVPPAGAVASATAPAVIEPAVVPARVQAAAAAPPPPPIVLPAPAAPAAPVALPVSPPLASAPPAPAVAATPLVAASVPPAPPPAAAGAAPLDPALVAVGLDPAPMTDEQQVQVLNLVTELGVLIRNQRTEIAALRTDQQSLRERVDGAMADFARRLALAEAGGAMSAAMGAGAPAAPPASLGPPRDTVARDAVARSPRPTVQPVAARVVIAPPSDPAAAASGSHRYRVQAASPSLAMLSELDPSGDDRALLEVRIGSAVPGYGRVTAIIQAGTSWQVRTDRGTIQ